jgi:hypothetical protein
VKERTQYGARGIEVGTGNTSGRSLRQRPLQRQRRTKLPEDMLETNIKNIIDMSRSLP